MRQAWEYESLVYSFGYGIDTTLLEDSKPASGTPLGRAAQLGADGWELAGMTATPNISTGVEGRVTSSTTVFHWFKRPK